MSLLERIRRGDYLPDTEAPRAARGGRQLSVAEVADLVRAGDEPLARVRDFLDQAPRRSDGELAALIRERPEPTGSPEVDALLAGVAEHLAAVRALPCPRWVLEDGRFLDRFWFVSPVRAFRALALAQTPVALKRRGIFWPARSLERV